MKIDYPSFESEKSLVVGEGDVWEGDICARRDFSDRLKLLIGAQVDACVIGLDGPWGSGKTFFLERFSEDLRREGKFCLLVNAWEHDWLGNPLLSLHKAIWDYVETESKVELFDPDAKKMLSRIAWGVVRAVANHYSRGALDAVLKEVGKASDEAIRNIFEEQTKLSSELRSALAKIGDAVYERTKCPLVVCIDELDRCRPTYAIELLERIKHFFEVPHVVFVLGYDLLQLSASIRSIYGEIDAETYLEKFVTISLRLSEISPVRLIDHFWTRYDLSSVLPSGTDKFCKILYQNLTRELHFTIRELRKIFQHAQLGLAEKSLPIVSILICILSVLKIKKPADYARYIGVRGVHRYEVMAALFPRAMQGFERPNFKISDGFLFEVASVIDFSLMEKFDYESQLSDENIARNFAMGRWRSCQMVNHAILEMRSMKDDLAYDERHCLVEIAAERLDLNAYWRAEG